MLLSDFDYPLPEELIAQQPLSDRAASRMLVVDRRAGVWQDRMFREFPSFVGAGDCIVLNDSRVFPSRLYGTREHGTGGRVEIFLTRQVSSGWPDVGSAGAAGAKDADWASASLFQMNCRPKYWDAANSASGRFACIRAANFSKCWIA